MVERALEKQTTGQDREQDREQNRGKRTGNRKGQDTGLRIGQDKTGQHKAGQDREQNWVKDRVQQVRTIQDSTRPDRKGHGTAQGYLARDTSSGIETVVQGNRLQRQQCYPHKGNTYMRTV